MSPKTRNEQDQSNEAHSQQRKQNQQHGGQPKEEGQHSREAARREEGPHDPNKGNQGAKRDDGSRKQQQG